MPEDLHPFDEVFADLFAPARTVQSQAQSPHVKAVLCRCGHADFYHKDFIGKCAIRRDFYNEKDCDCPQFNGGSNV